MNLLKLTLIALLLCAFGYFLIAITPQPQPLIEYHNDSTVRKKTPHIEDDIHTTINQNQPPAVNQLSSLGPVPASIQPQPYIPPITKSKNTRPYSGELDDHEAYKQFHAHQERELKMAFISASKQKIVRLEMLINRGIREGLSKEKIEFAKEKVSGLKAMSEQLQNELNTPH